MKVYGPYTRDDGRKHVILYANGIRTTVSYPKYLMEQKLGRKLTAEETVDHIDEDFTNDSPDNLQILTRVDNAKKSAPQVGMKICKCSKEFIPKRKEQKLCSKQCRWDYTETHKY